MNGSTALGTALPHLASVAMARGAYDYVSSVINNKPYIDPYSERGTILEKVCGNIELSNVHFSYSLRPDLKANFGLFFVLAGRSTLLDSKWRQLECAVGTQNRSCGCKWLR